MCAASQVQEFLRSLAEEELEVLKKELICIKNIFAKQDEAADGDDGDTDAEDEEQTKKEGGDEESVTSDSSSQLHFSTPLSE